MTIAFSALRTANWSKILTDDQCPCKTHQHARYNDHEYSALTSIISNAANWQCNNDGYWGISTKSEHASIGHTGKGLEGGRPPSDFGQCPLNGWDFAAIRVRDVSMIAPNAHSLLQNRYHGYGHNHHGKLTQKFKPNAILEAWREAQPDVQDRVRFPIVLDFDGGRRPRVEERCIFSLHIWTAAL